MRQVITASGVISSLKRTAMRIEMYKKLKKMLLWTIALPVGGLMLFPASAWAEEFTPVQLARELQNQYEKTITLEAEFTQVTTMKMTRKRKRGAGTIKIKKPGKMRWDYVEPARQVLICDGETVMMYFSSTNQLYVSPAKTYLQSDVTYSFFTGSGDILRDFAAEPFAPDIPYNRAAYTLKLVPKGAHPHVDHILLWLDKRFMIVKLQIIDHFGSVNDMTLDNIQTNAKIPEDVFTFDPPEDAEIIEQ